MQRGGGGGVFPHGMASPGSEDNNPLISMVNILVYPRNSYYWVARWRFGSNFQLRILQLPAQLLTSSLRRPWLNEPYALHDRAMTSIGLMNGSQLTVSAKNYGWVGYGVMMVMVNTLI